MLGFRVIGMNLGTAAAAPAREGASLPLGEDELEFGQTAGSQRWPCRISLITEPVPRLVFDFITRVPTISLDPIVTMRLVHSGCACEASVSSAALGQENHIQLTPTHVPVSIGGSQNLSEARLLILNFPEFFAGTRRNCLEVTADGWNIQVEPAEPSAETAAFRSGFFRVTHSARLRRSDGSRFDSTSAGCWIDALHAALSFAAGRWVAPALVRGWEAGERCAWQEWGLRRVGPMLSKLETWFDPYHGEALAGLFPGVLRRWHDPAWKEILQPALDWYLGAAVSEGAGEAILFLEAALEVLAWGIFVGRRKSLSAAGFQKLSSTDRIRLLLEDCQIPAGLPPGLASLKSKAAPRHWIDGPQALAALHRRLLHPDSSEDFPWAEGRELAAWYAELALLRLFEYGGTYSNRTRGYQRMGTVEAVPWAR